MYLIRKVEFDNSENRQPTYTNILGITITEDDAKDVIKTMEEEDTKYKGYDGEIYPKYKYEKVYRLK